MAGDWLIGPGGERLAAASDRQQHLAGAVSWYGDRHPPDLAEQALFRANGHVPPAFALKRLYRYITARFRCRGDPVTLPVAVVACVAVQVAGLVAVQVEVPGLVAVVVAVAVAGLVRAAAAG